MTGEPTLSVCVAVYKRHRRPNLASLAEQLTAAADGLATELRVALNGISATRAGAPAGAAIADLGTNRGVSVGWNRAAQGARGDVLVFINDDVALRPGSLRRLHDALRDTPGAGVAGPVGTLWDIPKAQHLAYLPPAEPGAVRRCDVLSGFLFATPRRVFEAVGGFDEAYTPCGFEEVDYCTTVRRRTGLECFEVAGVGFVHEFRISAKRPWHRVRYDGRTESLGSIARRNRSHFLAKWAT
jgi:GT2 family glycosyltransferase